MQPILTDALSPTSTPSTLAVSPEHVAQFSALLKSAQQMSAGSSASLDKKTGETEAAPEAVFEKQILKVQESEFFVERLHRHVTGGIEGLEGGHTMDGGFARSVSNLTFASSYYFLGTSRMASTAQDISDEISYVTRGK